MHLELVRTHCAEEQAAKRLKHARGVRHQRAGQRGDENFPRATWLEQWTSQRSERREHAHEAQTQERARVQQAQGLRPLCVAGRARGFETRAWLRRSKRSDAISKEHSAVVAGEEAAEASRMPSAAWTQLERSGLF